MNTLPPDFVDFSGFFSSLFLFEGAIVVPYHLGQRVPVVAVDLRGEVVEAEHVVGAVGQDAGTVGGPG